MIELSDFDVKREEPAVMVVPVAEDEEIHTHRTLRALCERVKAYPEFSGETGDQLILYDPPLVKAERVLFLGVGKGTDLTVDTLRTYAGKAVNACIRMKLPEALFAVPSPKRLKSDAEAAITAQLEGARLANHRFDRYLKEKKETPLKHLRFSVSRNLADTYAFLPDRVETIAGAVFRAREWVSTPANDKRPEQFAEEIVQAAEGAGIKAQTLTEADLKKGGYEAILAVGGGSRSKPALVVLEYGSRPEAKRIALVGKGVTFDTGGINLKPANGLPEMKSDMAGAAAVAAAVLAAAELKPDVHVTGVIPVVENMPSGDAVRPGDIVRTLSGTTVELTNTDAEGRLILADALTHAKTFKPDVIIDLATLTGACVVALGEGMSGLFTTDDTLAEAISRSAKRTRERCWPMPMPDDYREQLKSKVADLSNIGADRWGGAVTAALFLSEFAAGSRFAHIDIAGPAFAKKEGDYHRPGGTGWGVRLLCDFLMRETGSLFS